MHVYSPLDALKEGRIAIIGNSGSGKSWLAERLGRALGMAAIDLDAYRWTGNGYGEKRDENEARRLLLEATSGDTWIVEGVFTWLISAVIGRSTALVWLDLPWHECLSGLRTRGIRRGGTDHEFAELITWAEDYWLRKTPTSHQGHSKLFAGFPHHKVRLQSRKAVDSLLRCAEGASLD